MDDLSGIASDISERFRKIGAKSGVYYSLHEPTFSDIEKDLVVNCIETTFVSTFGEFVGQFEDKISKFVGAKFGIAVVNGTNALQVALRCSGIKANDEVIIPSLTFIATANAIAYLGAVPNFVDVDDYTLGIDPEKLETYLRKIGEVRDNQLYNKNTKNRISAIVPVHIFGHPVRYNEIRDVALKFNLKIVEDAAEALGSKYHNRFCGTLGDIGVFSFNGNKIITSGGGGMIVTNDESLADRCRHLVNTAKKKNKYEFIHDEIGYNYRLPNLNAALGLGQAQSLPAKLKLKRKLAGEYSQAFSDAEYGSMVKQPEYCESNYWLNTLFLKEARPVHEICDKLNDFGIMARPIWQPLHFSKPYSKCPKDDLSKTIHLYSRLISLPSSPQIIENV
ncbi:LegC family aminotransferase [Planktomarina temperata]|nr:LegC family aminotransferase [Planktomarina temperata]